MSLTNFDVALLPQYSSNVVMLAQQMQSRLRPYVNSQPIKAERYYFNRYDTATVNVITDRLADATLSDTNFSRIAVDMVAYGIQQGVDAFDLAKTSIADPLNPVTQAQSAAMGRYIDRIILTACGATAATGKAGGSTESLSKTVADSYVGNFALPSGAQGLQIAKIVRAYKLLADDGVDTSNLVMAVTPAMVEQLQAANEVTNKQYGISGDTLAALASGEIAKISGFKIIVVQPSDGSGNIVPTNGSSGGSLRRYAYAFDASGVGIAVAEDQSNATIYTDNRKYGATIASSKMVMGAVRIDPKKVVQISCTE